MTELVTYGSVGGAAGNSRSYPEFNRRIRSGKTPARIYEQQT